MAGSCGSCSKGRGARAHQVAPAGPRKQWRVYFAAGNVRDYITEADADMAIERFGGGRKQKLAS